MHKKPTGKDGFLRISFDDGEVVESYIKNNYPEIKEEIEVLYFNKFLEIFGRYNEIISPPFQNENDNELLDFTIKLKFGDLHIDLMEIAPLENGGYATVKNNYKIKDIADWIESKIKEKSEKYKNIKKNKALLLYATDFKFNLNDCVVCYLQIIFANNNFGFSKIFYINSVAMESFDLFSLFPYDVPYVDEEAIERIANMDLFLLDLELTEGNSPRTMNLKILS